ncbi:hypothetical protein ACFE04_002082 [Oxalis oulophora]
MAAAANSKGAQGIASLGKRVVNKISATPNRSSTRSSSASTLRRAMHTSSYDKNLDDYVRPTMVPDHMIDAPSSQYWAPHPQTGVFTPPGDGEGTASSGGAYHNLMSEEKAWFRPTSLEDIEKPHHH